jgi:tRNA-2-methylthio-N6-dimethylallyladenosine synthase
MAYIFKYSPRPTTEAASAEEMLPEAVKEERNQRLLSLLNASSIAYNETFVGTKQEVLVEGLAPHGENKLFGRNRYNKKVIFNGSPKLIGSFKEIFIEKATSSALEGRIVD